MRSIHYKYCIAIITKFKNFFKTGKNSAEIQLTEELHNIIFRERFEKRGVVGDEVAGEPALFVLEEFDFFFDAVFHDEAVGDDFLFSADSMRPVDRLIFHRGVPPRIENNHVIRRCEVDSKPARLEADEKKRNFGIVLKFINLLLTILRLPVDIAVANFFRIEVIAHDGERLDELGKTNHLVVFKEYFIDDVFQIIKFPGSHMRIFFFV